MHISLFLYQCGIGNATFADCAPQRHKKVVSVIQDWLCLPPTRMLLDKPEKWVTSQVSLPILSVNTTNYVYNIIIIYVRFFEWLQNSIRPKLRLSTHWELVDQRHHKIPQSSNLLKLFNCGRIATLWRDK